MTTVVARSTTPVDPPLPPERRLRVLLFRAAPLRDEPDRLLAEPDVLRLAVLPRLAVAPLRAAPRFVAARLVVLRFAAPFAPARFAVLRLAAPPVLRPRDADLDADFRAPVPLFFAAERRVLDALLAPEREDDDRLLVLPERFRAPPARELPVLLLERPAERVPLLRFELLRDDFVAMCGLLR